MPSTKQHGFTLVELSIVLVIIGLMIGGILSGQSLIRAAELHALVGEHQKFVIALNSFRGKYGGMPGDLANAESFWGTLEAADADCLDAVATGPETCNGNGNGNVEVLSARSREIWRFWQQLSNAGLVEGSYTGTSSTPWLAEPGTNVPASKFGGGAFAIVAQADVAVHGGWYLDMFQPRRPHWLVLGRSTGANIYPVAPLLKASEAWNVDRKMDDANPGRGNVTTMNSNVSPNCVSSDNPNSATYLLQGEDLACSLMLGL